MCWDFAAPLHSNLVHNGKRRGWPSLRIPNVSRATCERLWTGASWHRERAAREWAAMTDRKPPGVSWESWIDRQIVEGSKNGVFDELEGRGRPIRDLDRPHDDDWWIRAKLAREDVAVTPPTIAIRQDRDASLERALAALDEAAVRAIIEDLNDRIRAVNRSATWGPPSSVAPLDVDSIVERWRTARPVESFDGLSAGLDLDAEPDHATDAPVTRFRRVIRRLRRGCSR